jgi:hypothetical protein
MYLNPVFSTSRLMFLCVYLACLFNTLYDWIRQWSYHRSSDIPNLKYKLQNECIVEENGAKRRYMRKNINSVMSVKSLKLVGTFHKIDEKLQEKDMQWIILSRHSLEKSTRSSGAPLEWKPMLHGLVIHDNCIGGEAACALINELNAKFRNHLRSGNGVPVAFESKIIDFPHRLRSGETISPQYVLGEQQVAAIKWDGTKFMGKFLESVPKYGRTIYAYGPLQERWARANFGDNFIQLLQEQQKSFLWVPVGDSRPNSYPLQV